VLINSVAIRSQNIFLIQILGLLNAGALELRNAVVLTPPTLTPRERKAVLMLLEEVEKRSHVRWPETNAWPAGNVTVISVGPRSALQQFSGPYFKELEQGLPPTAPEGYRLCVRTANSGPAVFIIGNDSAGVLFGVGRLLRELRVQSATILEQATISFKNDFDLTTAPKYPLRGHQLGYRPKCNTYDAWDLPTWEQYFRDLAVFGCNAIELIPPRSDDATSSPHFPLPPAEMMVGMSRLADEYGLKVWVWWPALDRDYSDPKTVAGALREWGELFRRMPRLDAVFVPGGDPGFTRPKVLMPFLQKQTTNLHQFHPSAQMWVSPQGFDAEWLKEFLDFLKNEQPAWLSGIVYGPMVRVSLHRLRELVPPQYPIRHYPDITHSRQCEYPVPDWDVAYAVTEARECINPRPEGEAAIFRKSQPDTIGFLTYSEGCNDDVNKMIWSALGWEPDASLVSILTQYARYFTSSTNAENFAHGLLDLERNWDGSLLTNTAVEQVLKQFQTLESEAAPIELRNWRFQQALFRAYYDAYIRRRLVHETEIEERAMEQLRQAPSLGAVTAIAAAEKTLDRSGAEPIAQDLRVRIFQLAEALFQSIGMQLSVQLYRASDIDRGATLDTVDYPLNNALWLKNRFARIQKMKSEADRLQAIREIVDWTNPGAGGFYDDLGNPARQPHLVRPLSFADDPGAFVSPRSDFEEDLVVDNPSEKPDSPRRMSWMDHAEVLYDAPLQMRYTRLVTNASYKIKILYAGDSPRSKIRLLANNNIEIHPYLSEPFPFKPVEFPIPPAAIVNGELLLSWFGEQGLGGNGRSCQVSEVWLIKNASPSPVKR
jgi:hypothetical protein